MCFTKKFKRLPIYVISAKNEPQNAVVYAASLAEAAAYFDCWAKVKWEVNFRTWCNWSEGEDVNSDSSWSKFKATEYMQELMSSYVVQRLLVNAEGVASLMRTIDRIPPMPVNFIPKAEVEYYLTTVRNLESASLEELQKKLRLLDSSITLKLKEISRDDE